MRLIKSDRRASQDRPVWNLEGKIAGEYAGLLKAEFRTLTPEDRCRLLVDLEQVTFVDGQGMETLLEMERERASLTGAKGFVKELLQQRGKK